MFLPGDTIGSPPRCVDINIIDDDIVENEEEFTVSISSGSVIQAINVTSINVTIYEDTSDGMHIEVRCYDTLFNGCYSNIEFLVQSC